MSRAWISFVALLLFVALLALAPSQASAAKEKDKEDEVKIRWFGQSFFEIRTPKGLKIVTDPHNLEEYRIKAAALKPDLVLMSHFHTDHTDLTGLANAKTVTQYNALKKEGKLIDWNEIDEKMKDVRFYCVPTYHDSVRGTKHGKNGVWVIEIKGCRIVHLGDLGHMLNKAQLAKIGKVDVLMIPVGGVYTINGIEAQRVVEQIKPRRYILPMHYATPVFSDLLILKYFTDEAREAGLKIEKVKPKQWLTIDTKSKRPKQPKVAVLPYSWW
jgi:L-ascorbate metabolism protein UlaG (beta-lactamase superfamily)